MPGAKFALFQAIAFQKPMPIPKIISQTWKSEALPEDLKNLQLGWKKNNPSFDFRFYDDASSRAVVAEVRSEQLDLYDAMPHPVMRADMFRYAVIFRDGGFYADMDMESLAPLPSDLLGPKCLLSQEAHLDNRQQRKLGYRDPVQIANCIFGAEPAHPFFAAALDRGFALFQQNPATKLNDVEDVTGPRMLTRLLDEIGSDQISISAQVILMAPLHYPNIWPFNTHMVARHRTHGTWKGKSQRTGLLEKWISRNRHAAIFPKTRLRRHGLSSTSANNSLESN